MHKLAKMRFAVLVAAVTIGAMTPSFAADWTDASGNEYTALKYVKGNATNGGKSDGPWMVLTNITAQCTDTVKMKFKLVDTFTQGLWCSRKTSTSNFSAFYSVNSNKKISFYRKNSTAVAHSKVLNADDECTVIADYNARKFTVNGDTQTLSSLDSGSYDVGPIMLFGTYGAGTDATYSTEASGNNRGSYYLYYFQIYSSTGTLRHNLLPATNMTAQTVGLFDTVTRTFYTPNYSQWPNYKFSTAEYDNYTWGGGAAANWWASDVWLRDNVASSWIDYNNAIFNTANATVTLDNDVSAGKVALNEDATIFTNGTDVATLTVPTVSVAQNVSATIAAPTSGVLEKNGEGTLTLTENRTAATTVTAGTLKMDGATVSDLTLGTNGGAPVVFDYGGQSLQKNPKDYLVTGSDVTLTNGTFWMSGKMEIRDSAKIPAVLTIAKDATLQQTGDNNLIIDNTTGTATVNVVGGTLAKTTGTAASYLQHASLEGRLNINVTDGGLLTYSRNLYALCGGNNGSTPSLYMMFSDSTFHVGDVFHFGHNDTKVPTTPTGVLAATNSTINIDTTFYIGRDTQDETTAGSFTADFETCIVSTRWFSVYHDRPLNNARFNNTRFVFRGSGAIVTSDGADNWITVGDNGLTLDTQAYTCELNANLGGSGAVEKVGSGTLTVASNQTASAAFTVSEGTLAVEGGVSISRPMAVASGATLQVNATDTASISSLTPAAGSTLDIASYNGTTPLAPTSLTLPAEGKVNLTLNGGAFSQGVYKIYSKDGVTTADGDKFAPSVGEASTAWSVDGDTLVLTVGTPVHGRWRASALSGGKMSFAGNWEDGVVPAAGEDIDFSGISANRTIDADADRTFGAVTMGDGVITFTNALVATSFNDTSKIAVGANSTVTIDGDLEFSGSADEYIVNYVAAGGRFVVSGDIKAMPGKNGAVFPCVNYNQFKGTIVAKGLVNNSVSTRVNRFALTRGYNNTQVNWAVGEHGISGTDGFWKPNGGTIQSTITAEADFRISSEIAIQGPLTLDAKTHTIEITGDTARRGICGYTKNSSAISGAVTITGAGRVVVDYNVDNLTTKAAERSNPFTVLDTATLALKPGSNIGTGQVSVTNGATLAICESGTVTLNGGLALADGAALAFNFTERGVVPQFALAVGSPTVNGAVTVKVSSDCGWPLSGEKELTTCGGFTGVTVTLDEADKPNWAIGLNVNNDGNIVLSVKPKPMILIIR